MVLPAGPKEAFLTEISPQQPLAAAVGAYVLDCLHVVDRDRSETLLAAGEVNRRLYYVYRGLARSYHLMPDAGDEKPTFLFAAEGHFITSPPSFLRQRPSRTGIETLEDSTLVYITHQDLETLYAAFPNASKLRAGFAERYLLYYDERVRMLQMLTAKGRYEWFRLFHRELRGRVTDYQAASYLGMAAGTYRRIRKEMR